MGTLLRARLAFLVAGILLVGLGGPVGAANDKPAGNQKMYDLLRQVINRGADIHNGNPQRNVAGDPAGCYRLFQGALMVLSPHLDAESRKTVDAALADAERLPDMSQRAFALHKALNQLRDKVNPNPKKPAAPDGSGGPGKPPGVGTPGTRPGLGTPGAPGVGAPVAKTLWDRLGGEKNVAKVVDDFVAAAAMDPKIDFTRGGKFQLDATAVAKLKKNLIDMISQVSGGPRKYTGRGMKEAHAGMGITDAEFDASVAALKKTLEKNNADAADVKMVLALVGTTRSDIVEKKGAKPDDKKPDLKDPFDTKPPTKPIDDKKPDAKKPDPKKPDDKKSDGK